MKNLKKLVIVAAALGVIGISGVVYASTASTHADVTAGITGKTVEEVNSEHAAGKTYGTIAKEAGKLEEFKAQILEQKKEILDQRVKDEKLTQAQADEIYNNIKTNQATCDGTGSTGIGKESGVGFGQGQGNGQRNGQGNGMGTGRMLNK